MEGWYVMQQSNYGLIFVIIIAPFIMFQTIKTNDLNLLNDQRNKINAIYNSAVDDGTHMLVKFNHNGELYVDKQSGVDAFIKTLYMGFNIEHIPMSQQQLLQYIPVIAVIEQDGMNILSHQEFTDADVIRNDSLVWQPKKHFIEVNNNYIVNFTLTNYLVIYDAVTNETYRGYFEDLQSQFSSIPFMSDYTTFDRHRRNLIIDLIQSNLSYYINEANTLGSHFGVKYYFHLPEIPFDDWNNTIDDVSLISFFQGFPLKSIEDEIYNNYSIGGARIVKSTVYYVTIDPVTNVLVYYKPNNPRFSSVPNDKITVVTSQEEAARLGARPCLDD